MSGNSAWVGFDLDGTLAVYTTWQGIRHIGQPIPQMVEMVKEHLARGVKVKIFTARVSSMCPDGQRQLAIKVIQDWCEEHIGQRLEVTAEKDFQCIQIYDDRAVQVEFNSGRIITDEAV